MKTWIILPAFNEAENLPGLLEDVAAALTRSDASYAVLVVDDGSRDATADVARGYARTLPLHVVCHERNRGLARTIETGIHTVLRDAADDDIIVTMDADNSHPPALIPRMVAEVERGADLVIASRYAPGGAEEGVPLARRALSHGIGVLMRLRFGMAGVRDYSCGYRAYRARVLRLGLVRFGDRLIESQGFTVMAEVLVKLAPFCRRIAEVPLHLRYDLKRGNSKMRVLQTTAGYVRLLCSRPPNNRRPSSVGRIDGWTPLHRRL